MLLLHPLWGASNKSPVSFLMIMFECSVMCPLTLELHGCIPTARGRSLCSLTFNLFLFVFWRLFLQWTALSKAKPSNKYVNKCYIYIYILKKTWCESVLLKVSSSSGTKIFGERQQLRRDVTSAVIFALIYSASVLFFFHPSVVDVFFFK